MLIHDMQRNETRVINFQGSAPRTIKEEMLRNASEIKVMEGQGEEHRCIFQILLILSSRTYFDCFSTFRNIKARAGYQTSVL